MVFETRIEFKNFVKRMTKEEKSKRITFSLSTYDILIDGVKIEIKNPMR